MSTNIASNSGSSESAANAVGTSNEQQNDETSAPAPGEQGETIEASETSEEQVSAAEDSEESDEQEASQDDESEAKVDDKPKKQGGFKKKIGKLTSELSSERQEKEFWKQEALKGRKSGDTPAKEEPVTQIADLKGKPKPEDFDTNEDYVEAVADWKLDQREAKKAADARTSSLKEAQQKVFDTFSTRRDEYAKANSDYAETVENFVEEHGNLALSASAEQLIVTSEFGPAILHQLLKNPTEFNRINSLGALEAAKEIGKIEARMGSAAESAKKTIEVKASKAPAPIKTVGSNAGSPNKSIYDPNISFSDYEKLRREQSGRP